MKQLTLNCRSAIRLVALLTLLVVPLLTMVGCGQQAPAKTEAAKTVVADTTAKVPPEPTGLTALQPAPDSGAPAASAEKPAQPLRSETKVTGLSAIDRAAKAGKHLLLLFYRNDDDSTRAMKKVVASAGVKLARRANTVIIDVTDAAEREIVAKYQVDRAPMPLAMVVAPGGAVTGGFPGKVTEEQLSGAFVSPGLANSLKALQDGKLVLLCVQNASTKSNDAAMRGVNSFIADTRFAKSTEVVKIDPTDAQELKFLTQVQIDPKTSEAVTALMAPPGSVVAQYKGATDKDVMIAALAAKQAGGGGG